jgi:hypothetical protein
MLNQIPVLDKGYVALYSCAPNGQELTLLSKEFMRGVKDKKFADMTSISIKIKCPLFVQMTFAEYGLTHISQRGATNIEAFIPTVADIKAQTLEASEAIQADIEQTTDALLLNPKAYQYENCDLFISQVISPISVYNVLVVTGSLSKWKHFIAQAGFPTPIEAYRKAISEAVSAEYQGWL